MNFKLNDDDNNNAENNSDNRGGNKIIRILKITAIAAAVILGLFLLFKYVLFWILPFIIAWFIALIIQPAVKFLNLKLKLPRKLATVLFILILFAALGFIIFIAIDRIIYELNSFANNYSARFSTMTVSDYIDSFFAWLENSLKNVPFLNDQSMIENIKETINSQIGSMFSNFGSNIVARIPSFITSLAVTVPKMLLYTLITIISTFYISFDFRNINKFIAIQIPPKVRNVIFDIKSRFFAAIYKYIKAYSIIFLITYAELTVGFLIIGIKYAFILAALIALADFLPILGTGTFLIPWGIISIVQKDYFTGFALLILYATILIIRNVIEPKIVGTTIGLYPVVTLVAMFVGFNILGLWGMLLFPISILIVKNLNDEGKIHLWKNIKNENVSDSDGKKKK
ncbi:MAG: sporulation integral membrane protein YtvI [Oscillospiraceae bacterium]|nr:sporulation integral membrane protein YtvI [Oscillospiraceae bacterium]